ncbi:hypothetical protein [Phaeobacter phage MD18]|nr:hypothetical protein [Phaeobacter phage MD18]
MTTEIFRCVAGSRLFGTATESSDTDYKAVHVPDARSILLGTANAVIDQSTGSNDTANSADDVDMVSFPVQKYLSMLAKMETNALEMLFAPNQHDDWLWDEIKNERFRLMSRNKKAFTGYAKGQAMRYSVRGDRVASLEKLVTILECLDPNRPMNEQNVNDVMNQIKGVKVYEKRDPQRNSVLGYRLTPYLTAFGRECPMTCKPKEALSIYRKPLVEAGKRSRDAASGDGPDWKGLYHAQRIVDEGLELFATGELVFPCREASYYLQIRSGELPVEAVLNRFEERLEALEEIEPIPEFRDEADKKWIDEFVMSVHEQKVVSAYEEWRAAS